MAFGKARRSVGRQGRGKASETTTPLKGLSETPASGADVGSEGRRHWPAGDEGGCGFCDQLGVKPCETHRSQTSTFSAVTEDPGQCH